MDLSESELTLLNPLPSDREAMAAVGSAGEAPPDLLAEASELLQAPDPGAVTVAPPQAGPFAAEAPPASLEPMSLTPSVADVELSSALAQARRGRRTWAFSAAAAIVLGTLGTGFAIHQQRGPALKKAPVQAEPVQPKPVAVAPATAARPKPEASPAVGPPEAASAPAAVGDFAAAFAAAPSPDAKAYPEVIVRVSPLGAQIYDGPKLLAQTAARVSLAPGTKKTLMVHLEGYQSRQVLVDGSSESVNIVMRPAGATAAEPTAQSHERSQGQASGQASSGAPATKSAVKVAADGDILPPL